jgi:hypothetical protein
MIYELRRYELFSHNKKAFHDRFQNHFLPLSEKYGFKLIGAWDTEIGDGPSFTYILADKPPGMLSTAMSNGQR